VLRALAGLERGAGHIALGDAVWQDDAQRHLRAAAPAAAGLRDPGGGAVPASGCPANLNYGLRQRAGVGKAPRSTR
jgi:hypothetical protein